jgi:hypothetical protein
MGTDYVPVPRENSTLTTSSGQDCFLIGGNSFEAVKEISVARIEYSKVIWHKFDWKPIEPSL